MNYKNPEYIWDYITLYNKTFKKNQYGYILVGLG
jgi:hypothetical protein